MLQFMPLAPNFLFQLSVGREVVIWPCGLEIIITDMGPSLQCLSIYVPLLPDLKFSTYQLEEEL